MLLGRCQDVQGPLGDLWGELCRHYFRISPPPRVPSWAGVGAEDVLPEVGPESQSSVDGTAAMSANADAGESLPDVIARATSTEFQD